MKANLLKDELALLVRTLVVSFGTIGISLQMAAISFAQRQQSVGTRLLIPSSAYTDTFSSSLVVQNLELGPNRFTISAYDTSGNPLGTPLTTSLLYGDQFRSSNILKDLGAPQGSFGPIKVESLNNQLLSAGSEVRSSQGFAGFFTGVNIETAWNFGMILDVVDDGTRGTSTTYRTNLGLNAVRPGSTNVTIALYSDTGVWAGTMSTTLPANGLTQIDGIVQRLRVSTLNKGEEYSLFFPAVPAEHESRSATWLFGLQQNEETRSNLAIVNLGTELNRFTIELFDGKTGMQAGRLEGLVVNPQDSFQLNSLLADYTTGVNQGYARVVPSNTEPFITYAVIIDGARPGERTGDGSVLNSSP